MDPTRQVMRRILPAQEEPDKLTVQDLHDYNITKSILVGDTWYTIRRQNKALQRFLLSVADFEQDAGANPHWISFQTVVDMVNKGQWGFQHKDERRGEQGWFGRESPRHIGRHDKD